MRYFFEADKSRDEALNMSGIKKLQHVIWNKMHGIFSAIVVCYNFFQEGKKSLQS